MSSIHTLSNLEARADAAQRDALDGAKKLVDKYKEAFHKYEEQLALLSAELDVERSLSARKITVLEAQVASLTSLQPELEAEGKKRIQAESERDYLLEIFQKRKPAADHIDPRLSGTMSPVSFMIHNEQTKKEYDCWEQEWQGYLLTRDPK